MLTVNYGPRGTPANDFWIQDIVTSALKRAASGEDVRINTSSHHVITAFKLAIARGELSHTDVEFSYGGVTYLANRYGAIPDAPAAFMGPCLEEQLLTAAIRKKKEDRDCSLKI